MPMLTPRFETSAVTFYVSFQQHQPLAFGLLRGLAFQIACDGIMWMNTEVFFGAASTGWNVPTCHAHDRQFSPHSLPAVPPADSGPEDLQRVVIDSASSVPGETCQHLLLTSVVDMKCILGGARAVPKQAFALSP